MKEISHSGPAHQSPEEIKSDDSSVKQSVLSDLSPVVKAGIIVLILGLFGGGLWAALAPLDEGVPTMGSVAIDTKRKAVQHLKGGIVREILVKEGSFVKQGDTLIRLEGQALLADYLSTKQNYIGLRASESRLFAEQSLQKSIVFHPDIMAEKNDPLVVQHINNQEYLFRSRRSAVASELAAIKESISGNEFYLNQLQLSLTSRKSQLSILREELKGIITLAAEGYLPKSLLLEKQQQEAALLSSMDELQGNAMRTQSSILEFQQRLLKRQQDDQNEIQTQQAEIRRQVDGLGERMKALRSELDRLEIKAPVSGQVVGLSIQTPGAVIQTAQKLMDIVPENEILLLEAHIPPHLIDRVKPGLPVDARFSAFAHAPQLVVEGRIDSVSGDLLTTSPDQPPYYLARVTVTESGIQQLGQRSLYPGMPVEIIVKTGERSLLTYLLHPLTKRLAASLKEE